ncbi:hypothetical protein LBJG_00315 [Lactobacillus jensenii 1153]|nr:hypothetical protein LBJG_00315 [Lactobacillus jensenii 1153]
MIIFFIFSLLILNLIYININLEVSISWLFSYNIFLMLFQKRKNAIINNKQALLQAYLIE